MQFWAKIYSSSSHTSVINHPSESIAEVKDGVELFLYSLSGPFVACYRWNIIVSVGFKATDVLHLLCETVVCASLMIQHNLAVRGHKLCSYTQWLCWPVSTLLQHLLKIVLVKSVSVTETWFELKLFNTLMVLEHLHCNGELTWTFALQWWVNLNICTAMVS